MPSLTNSKVLTKKGTLKSQYKDPPRFPVLRDLDKNVAILYQQTLKNTVKEIVSILKQHVQ